MKFKKILLVGAIVGTLLMSVGCSKDEKTIHIGHKNYTEQRILGELFAVLVENNTDYKADVKEFGGTNVAFEALKTGSIDVYAEYTGTAYGAILGQEGLSDADKVFEYVKEEYKNQYDIIWGNPLGFNNTYTLAVIPDIQEKYNLKTISDISKVASELTLISEVEFTERSDGLPGLQAAYDNFEFKDVKSMDAGLRYAAIDSKEGEVTNAFSTDGKLLELNLVVLKDDKSFFPPYYAAPIFNGNFAKEHGDIIEVFNTLADQITEEEMQKLNYRVDTLMENEKKVAEEFLKSKNLIP